MDTELELDQEEESESQMPLAKLKANVLRPGSKVALVAPASRPEKPSVLGRCTKLVEDMGFVPVLGNHVLKYDGFSAGSDEERLEDMQRFLEDDGIEALFCLSGGYGALRLLPLLDFGQVRKCPKVIVGGGDNDAILLAINQLTSLVVFHGPNLDEIKDEKTFENFRRSLCQAGEGRKVCAFDEKEGPDFDRRFYSLSESKVEGELCGGNLTALSSLYGTRYQCELAGKILALDDFSERSSILDRWFTTLYLAGSLRELAGIAFGAFPGCGPRGSNNMLSIEDSFGDRLKETGPPACFGFKFGSSYDNNLLAVGIKAQLDCASGTLCFLESALI